MKKILAIVIMLVSLASASAQVVTDSVFKGIYYYYEEIIEDDAYIVDVYYDTDAEFPGGEDSMYSFLAANIRYPETTADFAVNDKVYVQFNVEKDGSITNIMIKKDIGFGWGREVKRAMELMPKWKPASYRGEPVALTRIIAVRIHLE